MVIFIMIINNRGEVLKRYIDLILGIILILYSVSINLIFGKITFSEVFLLIGVLCIIYHFIKNRLMILISKNKILKTGFNVVRFLVSIGLIIFVIIEATIIIFPKQNNSYSNYVVILGAGVKGETPSLTLVQRLEKAIEYVRDQKNEVKIVVSGGQGPDENISEAEAMKRYLVKNGINERKILMEDKSRDTRENLQFSKEIIEKNSNKSIEYISVKIITSDFHAFRSNLIAKNFDYGDRSFLTNKTLPALLPVMYTREFFAIIKYFLVEIFNIFFL